VAGLQDEQRADGTDSKSKKKKKKKSKAPADGAAPQGDGASESVAPANGLANGAGAEGREWSGRQWREGTGLFRCS